MLIDFTKTKAQNVLKEETTSEETKMETGPKVLFIDAGPSERGFSYFGTALLCLQKWRYAQEERKQRTLEVSDALRKGAAIHGCLAHYYASKMKPEVKVATILEHLPTEDRNALLIETKKISGTSRGAEVKRFDFVLSRHRLATLDEAIEHFKLDEDEQSVIRSYIQNWEGIEKAYEVVAVEKQYEIFFKDPRGGADLRVTYRADVVLSSRDGTFIMDHKTTGFVESRVAQRYVMHGQMLVAWQVGYANWGKKFKGVFVNILPSTSKNTPHYIRQALPYPARAVEDIGATLHRANRMITALEGSAIDSYPKALHEEACVSRYGQCPYTTRCMYGFTPGNGAVVVELNPIDKR